MSLIVASSDHGTGRDSGTKTGTADFAHDSTTFNSEILNSTGSHKAEESGIPQGQIQAV